MSWAEVKKFLNKRNDKSLDEIILETELNNSGGIVLASGKYTKSGTVLKIEGKGRLYYFTFDFWGTYGYTCKFEVVIDGKVAANITKKDTASSSNRLFRVVSYGQHTPKNQQGYALSIYNANGDASEANLDRYMSASGESNTIQSASNQNVGLLIPDYLLFNESVEVVVTFTGTMADASMATYNYATIGYKLD